VFFSLDWFTWFIAVWVFLPVTSFINLPIGSWLPSLYTASYIFYVGLFKVLVIEPIESIAPVTYPILKLDVLGLL